MIVASRPAIAIVFPASPPAQVSVPRTMTAPGESCCRSDVASRQSFGITGAIWISTSPPGRLLPQERAGLRPRLAQLQETGARLVREPHGRAREHEAREHQEDERGPHRDPPAPTEAACDAAGWGFSIVTVYFCSSRS